MRNHWIQKRWKLKIRRLCIDPLTYDYMRFELKKGPYIKEFDAAVIGDLRDACGLDAGYEMACILKDELERWPWDIRFNWPMPKRMELTKNEFAKIVVLCRKLRLGEDVEFLLK